MAELSISLIFAAVGIALPDCRDPGHAARGKACKLMATATHSVETKTPKAKDPNAIRAVGHIAQAWAILGEIDSDEARAVRAILRALVPQVENIRPQRTT